MAHPHHAFQFIVQFVITVPCVMYRQCYSNNVGYGSINGNSFLVHINHKNIESAKGGNTYVMYKQCINNVVTIVLNSINV